MNAKKTLYNESFILGAIGVLGFLAVWQFISSVGIVNPFLISSPLLILSAFVDLAAEGKIIPALLASGKEFLIGFGLAISIGIPVGYLMGWNDLIEATLDPYVWFLYSAPLIAFYPLFIFWLGMGTPTVIMITFLLSLFPVLVNTMTGVRTIDRSLIRVARSFGASEFEIFRKISLPGSLPIVVAGLRLGAGRALVGVVIGEFFGANAGLGFNISYYGGRMRTTEMFVFLVIVAIAGILITQLLRSFENQFTRWKIS